MTPNRIAIVACTLALAVIAGPTFASGDVKYVPGAVCQGVSTTSFFYNNQGEVYNTGGLDSWLTCPMVRDSSGLNDFNVQLSVYDNHPAIAIECTARSHPWNTPGFYAWTSDASTGTGRDTLTMTLYTSHTDASHQVLCRMPRINGVACSYVTSIRYEEF